MSGRNPGDDRWRDPRNPPDWSEEPGSSVFDRPTARPRPPERRPPPDDRTLPHETVHPGPGQAPPQQPGWPPEPGPGAYRGPPPPGRTPQGPPPRRPGPPGADRGGADPYGRRPGRSGPEGRDWRERDAAGRGAEPSGGRGFPLGAGALFGVVGLACFLAALLVLPWFSAAGQDVALADIREAFEIPATDPDGLLPGSDDTTPTTLPEGIPSPEEAQEALEDAIEQQVRDTASQAAAGAIDTGKSRYLELYTGTLWGIAAVAVGLAVLFSTILAPRSAALSLLLGFRRLAGVVVILVGVAHGAALWIVFTGESAPDPAFGVWLGLVGLALVLVGCIVGPKR